MLNVDTWLPSYLRNRYGFVSSGLLDAWNGLLGLGSVYSPAASDHIVGPVIVGRPMLDSFSKSPNNKVVYDQRLLHNSWKLFVAAALLFSSSKGGRYDLADISRQVLSDYSSYCLWNIIAAIDRGDSLEFKKQSAAFLGLINDMDRLTGYIPSFRPDSWLNAAYVIPGSEKEKWLYVQNVKNLITTWYGKTVPCMNMPSKNGMDY